MKFDTVLIANRGEIARRVIRTCRSEGYRTVAVFSDADRDAMFVRDADEAVHIGPAPSSESYLRIERLIEAAKTSGAGAIHPGYGFLAENAGFASACADAGLVFIGPDPEAIRVMGSKIESKRLMEQHDVPVIPGYKGDDQTPERLKAEATRIGFPLLLKASAGGGGKGMRLAKNIAELEEAIPAARREAMSAFSDDTLFLEKYVEQPRHVEFQILGDTHGNLIHVFERECSIQRRHQKIIEETPSTALDPKLREQMGAAAVRAGEAIGYFSAGTVEFLLAPDRTFYFLEMNTRLQVEHPVTEMTTGLDLVALQLLVAQGGKLPLGQQDLEQSGHSIECRLYSENPENQFLPATGTLYDWHFGEQEGLRVDTGVKSGDEVSIHYDPLLAKVVTWGETREQATRRMIRALDGASIQGVVTNRAFLTDILRTEAWESGALDTHFIESQFPEGWSGATPTAALEGAAIIASLDDIARRQAGRTVLTGIPLGYRNNRWRDSEAIWCHQDQNVELRYHPVNETRFQFSCGDRAWQVELIERNAAAICVEVDGHRFDARVVRVGERVWVHLRGWSVELESVPRFPEAEAAVDAGSCLAPMPGKVLQVLVAAGDSVSSGQALVIMEAMKMEHTISAPADGTVETVLVEVGAQVDADEALVKLADPDD